MAVPTHIGNIELRDPVTAAIEFDFLLTAIGTDALVNACYVPTCEKLVCPIYTNGSGTSVVIVDLKTGKTTTISGLQAGTYQAAYCPINDLVYVVAWQGPTVRIIDPWTEALHTTSTVSGSFSGILLSICFCPLNGKLYAISRSGNNIARIDPTTNAVDSTFATAGGYDLITYSDNLRKMIITAATGAGNRTVDPLNSDAVATIAAFSVLSFSTISIPKTGEVAFADRTNNVMRFMDQSLASVTTVSCPDIKMVGWNPVTEKVWAVDATQRQFWIVDPVTR